ncbi:HEXXH motif domain-containing protein [Thermomonospora umbrina]|uniref:HEXXH motif domain-containing protein n=1 Tax=Thermomonospora umbrina TaxID=111806 RepID=UPI001FEA691D|nr:HEXXH motif domain-containing protein [Thermomonospora umbrina]
MADEARSAEVNEAARALAGLHDHAPDAVERVLRQPAVGAWARHTAARLRRGEPAPATTMAQVTASAAIRAGADYDAVVPIRDGAMTLPGIGRCRVDGDRCHIVVRDGRAELRGRTGTVRVPADGVRDAPGWRGLREVILGGPGLPTLRLTIDDLDPYRFPGGGPRLPDGELTRWRTLFQEAWHLLCAHHEDTAAEIRAVLTTVTPLDGGPGRPQSGTSRTAFGATALRLPPNAGALAAVLVHEIQHAKLGVLLELVDLVDDDPGRTYYAPWRPDPRPLGGLLHGAYAHLGLAAFWRRQRHHSDGDEAHARFVRWRDAALATTETLQESGALTPAGVRFVAGMRRTLHAFHRDPVPAQAVRRAHREAAAHRSRYG